MSFNHNTRIIYRDIAIARGKRIARMSKLERVLDTVIVSIGAVFALVCYTVAAIAF